MESMFTTATDAENKEIKVEVTPPKKKLFGGMRDNNSISLDAPPKELVVPSKRRGRPRKVKPLNGEGGESAVPEKVYYKMNLRQNSINYVCHLVLKVSTNI